MPTTYLHLSACQVSFNLLSVLSLSIFYRSSPPSFPILGFIWVVLISIWLVWYASIQRQMDDLHDLRKIAVRLNLFNNTWKTPVKTMVMQKWKSLCSAIKSHVILGPSKLPAAYHSLSGDYLPYYILSAIR